MIYAPIKELSVVFKKFPQISSFVQSLNKDSSLGKHQISGDDIYGLVAEYDTKKTEDAKLESHREYADIQIMISGEELGRISWIPRLEILSDEPSKDLILYKKPAKFASEFLLYPGVFAVFYPYDAHTTQIEIGTPQKVKKAVVKIRAKLIS